ncbi:MAG: hypothetical protein ABW061_27680 [Polyangiaceae bacterium]
MRARQQRLAAGSGVGALGELISCQVMADDSLLEPAAIDALLEADDLEGAREALQRAPATDERYAVARIKLALCDGSMPSGAAMQALIQLMRKNPDWPGAKHLYQSASSAAFETRQSSVSHSHPPPPVERK